MSTQTIIALYDNKAAARQVLEELRTAGYGDEFWLSSDSAHGSGEASRFSTLSSEFSAPTSRTTALTRLGIPADDAEVYSEGVRRGGVLLVGQVDDSRTQQALDIIERHQPVDTTERGELYRQSGWTGYDATAADYDETSATEERSRYAAGLAGAAADLRGANTSGPEREEVIPVTEESLEVGKREVERGRVRVRSFVVETPVEETVTLRDETVQVERRAVSRDVADLPADAFRERTIEVTETDEEAVVAKTARVVEEVVVRKDVAEEVRTIRDTVRRTEVEIEDDRTSAPGTRPLTEQDRSDI